MKDLKYFQNKCERLERVVTMRECQLRCACDGLEAIHQDSLASVNPAAQIGLIHATTYKTLEAVDAIYALHHGESYCPVCGQYVLPFEPQRQLNIQFKESVR